MFTRRRVRGLLVQKLYEDLNPEEEAFLSRQLEGAAQATEEAESLERLVAGIPSEQPELTTDLLPLVRARLEERRNAANSNMAARWGGTAALAACLLLVFGFGFFAYMPSGAPGNSPDIVATGGETTPVNPLLEEAAALMAQHEYGSAHDVLQTAIETHPTDPNAGRAQEMLAGLYYDELHRYRDAYGAYVALKRDYPQTFMGNGMNADRLDLLDEARRVNYASLEALDAARMKRGDAALAALQEVIVQHAGPEGALVASLAAEEMAGRVVEETSQQASRLTAMESARDRCTNPVAVARLNVEIGRIYLEELDDPATARDLCEKALSSGHSEVIAMAQTVMSAVDATLAD